MKALDTPVLLSLLHGVPSAKALVKSLSGEELATTEANLLELSAIAARGAKGVRTERTRALERLRRRLTVLPIDAQGGLQTASRLMGEESPSRLLVWAMYGALEAHGCTELITDATGNLPGHWRFKVRHVRT